MTRDEPGSGGAAGLDLELRSLAKALALPPADDQLVDAIVARLDREPVPQPPNWGRRAGAVLVTLGGWLQNRWRTVGVALAAALLVLLTVTPAGAKVREWLGFGAVVIEQQQPVPTTGPGAPATSGSGVPAAGRELPLDQVLTETSFPVGVPAALGVPDRVTVSADGRLVTMEWLAAVRLDQINGALSPYFLKKLSDEVDYTVVNGQPALWLPRTHPILILNPDGSERAESARQSGPSLVWQNAGVTLRLEGVADQQAAVAIAESMPN